jgi:DNA-binding MarR family transcriptional regulator
VTADALADLDRVLEHLAHGPRTTRDLATALGRSVLSVTQAARVLERDGQVATERWPGDLRVLLVRLREGA